jgi:hypothetical protein
MRVRVRESWDVWKMMSVDATRNNYMGYDICAIKIHVKIL